MPGINVYEIFILIVLAMVLLGPERLPHYAKTLAQWAKHGRQLANEARARFENETGTSFENVDWKKYDPRQYDPRKILRDALADEPSSTTRKESLNSGRGPREIFQSRLPTDAPKHRTTGIEEQMNQS